MPGWQHRFVDTNGIRMHFVEEGTGPLVVLCHGFPESWYSWRHQIPALAAAGYRVVAPDQRGYGQTEAPEDISKYTQLHLVGDIVGLLDALGEETAVIAGHDWGAPVAWNSGVLRPDRFRAVIGLSVPYFPRTGNRKPTDMMKELYGDNFFYQLYFQEPGKAEAELDADPRGFQRMFLYSASGVPEPRANFQPLHKTSKMGDQMTDPGEDHLPPFITKEDLDFYGAEFARAGFRGGLNWYRNIDRNWELMAPFDGAKMRQPALFIAGDRDGVIVMAAAALQKLPESVPNLKRQVLIPGVGHWTQQEAPQATTDAMLTFLRELDA